MKVGDLGKRKEGLIGHDMCGVGLVLFNDDIVTRVKWQGDYGTFMQVPGTLEVVSEAR